MVLGSVVAFVDEAIYRWYRLLARNARNLPSKERILAGFYARKVYICFHFLAINLQLAYIALLISSGHHWQLTVPAIILSTYELAYLGLFIQKRLLLLPTLLGDSLGPVYYLGLTTKYCLKYANHGHNPQVHLALAILVVISSLCQWSFLMVLLRDYCRVEKETEADDRDCFWEVAQVLILLYFAPFFLILWLSTLCTQGADSEGGTVFSRSAFFKRRGRAGTHRGRKESQGTLAKCSVLGPPPA